MRYADVPGLNASALKLLLTSPRAYRMRESQPTSRSMLVGSALHCAVLEPETFTERYYIQSEAANTKTGKAAVEMARARDLETLTGKEGSHVRECAAALRQHPEVRSYIDRLQSAEETITWTRGSRPCKGRVDGLLKDGTLIGIKTTRELARFQRQATSLHYPLQWAWYHDGLDLLGRRPRRVVELVVETAWPFDAACFIVPDAVLELGRDQYERALDKLEQCEQRNEWPGQYPRETLLVLPDWAYEEAHPDEEIGDDGY